MTQAPATPPPAGLREPAHQVSPRAVGYWRIAATIPSAVVAVLVVGGYVVWWLTEGRPSWWALVLAGLVLVVLVVYPVVMPPVRYRVHRWEVTDTAIHTRAGWITISSRIAPLSRVQTVDSRQGALMRLFRLASLTVTTASAAGPITIDCLDAEQARELVATLTAITGASEGDAT
ncbi:PH domain-containing protein [Nocardioides sediminis]|uniref:PH domain-containing protein n=1 Tax=Nocardioides sediminis TaxID=433648 RepID=UPI000D3250C0|nr:PH domain-containing protein [Nocardioides sediminis]